MVYHRQVAEVVDGALVLATSKIRGGGILLLCKSGLDHHNGPRLWYLGAPLAKVYASFLFPHYRRIELTMTFKCIKQRK